MNPPSVTVFQIKAIQEQIEAIDLEIVRLNEERNRRNEDIEQLQEGKTIPIDIDSNPVLFYSLRSIDVLSEAPCLSPTLKTRTLNFISECRGFPATLYSLCQHKEEELLRFRGLGKKSVAWIKEALWNIRLTLGCRLVAPTPAFKKLLEFQTSRR